MSTEIDFSQLKIEIEEKLCELLGEELADENLAEYVVACVSKRCEKEFVQSSLAEVLGLCCEDATELSGEMCDWVYARLDELHNQAEYLEPAEVPAPSAEAATHRALQAHKQAPQSDDGYEEPKKSRVREKIVYKMDAPPAKKSRMTKHKEEAVSRKTPSTLSAEDRTQHRSGIRDAQSSKKKARAHSPNQASKDKQASYVSGARDAPSSKSVPSKLASANSVQSKAVTAKSAPSKPVPTQGAAGLFKAALRATVTSEAPAGSRDHAPSDVQPVRSQGGHRSQQQEADHSRSKPSQEMFKGSVFDRLAKPQDSPSPNQGARTDKKNSASRESSKGDERSSTDYQMPQPQQKQGNVRKQANSDIGVKLPSREEARSSAQPNSRDHADTRDKLQHQSNPASSGRAGLEVSTSKRQSVFHRLAGGASAKTTSRDAPLLQSTSANTHIQHHESPTHLSPPLQSPVAPAQLQLTGGKRRSPDSPGPSGSPTKRALVVVGKAAEQPAGTAQNITVHAVAPVQHGVNGVLLASTGSAPSLKCAMAGVGEATAAKRSAVTRPVQPLQHAPVVAALKPEQPKTPLQAAPTTDGAAPKKVLNGVTKDEAEDIKRRLELLQKEIKLLSSNLKPAPAAKKPVAAKPQPIVARPSPPAFVPPSSPVTADTKSVVVTNVHYDATPEVVSAHFTFCGYVKSVNIATDLYGNPKGYAFVEFGDQAAVTKALSLTGSILLGRQVKVVVAQPSFGPKPALAAKPAVVPKRPAFNPNAPSFVPGAAASTPSAPAPNPALPPGFGGISDLPAKTSFKPNTAALAAAKPLPQTHVWVRPHGTV